MRSARRRALDIALLCAAACGCAPNDVTAVLPCTEAELGTRAECPAPEPTASLEIWPSEPRQANSDPWLVEHHDDFRELRPRLIVLNFHNPLPGDAILPSVQTEIDALAEGSRYHGYTDPAAPEFLRYELERVVDLTDAIAPEGWPYLSSTRVPVGADGAFDPEALFSDDFATALGIEDPDQPGRSMALCEVFERGIAHEVWLAVGDGMREPPLMMERKQIYDAELGPIPGAFQPCVAAGGRCIEVPCNVTVRLAHLNPRRGPGCDLQVRGWSFLTTGLALPYFADNAGAYFNGDLRARFGVPFDDFYDICPDSSSCIDYPSPTSARAADASSVSWQIDSFRQGCGSPEFPPNATARWAWSVSQPVESRCEHYGLRDGDTGEDRYRAYSADTLPSYDERFIGAGAQANDCGGSWQLYWRQNMPGLGNGAVADDGSPMKNWWPFLFY
jgi:hypothetical protein